MGDHARSELAWLRGALALSCALLFACDNRETRPADVGKVSEDHDGGADDGLELTRDDDRVAVPSGYQTCNSDAECVFVPATCSGCCIDVPISSQLKSEYESRFIDVCRDYRGGICDCEPSTDVARCRSGRCVSVPRDEIGDCDSRSCARDR